MTDLSAIYRDYIDCLNNRKLQHLSLFVHDDVVHNNRPFGLAGYTGMLQQNFADIPDLYFTIQLMITENNYVASRLGFDCTPKGEFLGIPVHGRKVVFTENVFYLFREGKIQEVWSVVDKAAIETQIQA
jgi:Predicted ester cyclase